MPKRVKDDDLVPLPALDGDPEQPDGALDFGENEVLTAGDAPSTAEDLELGTDDPLESDLETTADEAESWTDAAEEAGEMVGGDLGLGLVHGAAGSGEEGRHLGDQEQEGPPGLDGADDTDGAWQDGIAPLAPLHSEAEEVLDELGERNDDWLEPLPPLDDDPDADVELDEEAWADSDGLQFAPEPHRLSHALTTNLRPIQGLDPTRNGVVQGLFQGAPVVFAGGLYGGAGSVAPRLLAAERLAGTPLSLVASGGPMPRLWAVSERAVQYSCDGGQGFEPAIAVPSSVEGPVRAAATDNGVLWLSGGGALCRVSEVDGVWRADVGTEPAHDVCSDGRREVAFLGEGGRLYWSADGGQQFEAHSLHGVQGDHEGLLPVVAATVIVQTDVGLWTLQRGATPQPLVEGSCTVATAFVEHEAVEVCVCLPAATGWSLVRYRALGQSEHLGHVPADMGTPRSLLVYPGALGLCILVGADHGFLELQVPFERT